MNQNSFLQQSEDIRTSYLVILNTITTADRQNTPEEIAFVEQMAIAADLSEANRALVTAAVQDTGSVNLADHITKFKDNELRFSLVTDLLNLCYSDGSLNANEIAELNKINGTLGISPDQFDALKKYVEAANKENEATDGNSLMDANGQPKTPSGNFLDKIGLSSVFKSLGIPTDNFASGATIAVTLTTAAYFLIKNYMNTQGQAQGQATAQNASNPLSGFLGTALSGLMGGQQQTGQAQGNSLMNMVTGFVSSQAGQAAIGSVLGSVMSSTSKGNGLGNLMNIIGGGKQQQGGMANLTNILGSFLK
jgi:uncharacterized tellurite resistance protein B-like protein